MEKRLYYAIFTEDGDGWSVRFPDADSTYTCGDTLEEAQFMAEDAISGMLVVGRKGREYNDPRSYSEIAALAGDGELVFPVMAREELMEAYKPKKRINVMMPVDLLDKVNKIVKDLPKEVDRSAYICKAVEAMIA